MLTICLNNHRQPEADQSLGSKCSDLTESRSKSECASAVQRLKFCDDAQSAGTHPTQNNPPSGLIILLCVYHRLVCCISNKN